MQVMNSTKFLSIYIVSLFFITKTAFAQSTNNLSSSPYSLYGLGLSNDLNTGKTNSLANTGIAMPSKTMINGLNPASLGTIPNNRFFYEIGLKLEQEKLYEDGSASSQASGNFSSLAIAFPLTKKSGVGVTLIPVTNVGYSILGLEKPIDGSTDTFLSNINGSGGLSNLQLSYGYSVTNKIRLGLKAAYLFGQIEEEEIDYIQSNVIRTTEEDFYDGFRVSLGAQYDFSKKLSFGGVVNFPVELNAEQTKTVTLNGTTSLEDSDNLDSFKLPLEVGFGISTQLNEKFLVNLDLKRDFWDATEQSDYIGTYVDRSTLSVGAEYLPKRNPMSYWERINYRAGFKIDNGNLSIEGNRINSYNLSVGAGFPVDGRMGHSMINFSYSYSRRGQVSNGLIRENFHTVSLNFSLEDMWFMKRKYE